MPQPPAEAREPDVDMAAGTGAETTSRRITGKRPPAGEELMEAVAKRTRTVNELKAPEHNDEPAVSREKLEEPAEFEPAKLKAAMESEIRSLLEIGVIRPASFQQTVGHKIINTRWVHKEKMLPHGLGIKSRLVVKDFNDGSTSTDLHAGTPCMSSLRAILVLASWHQNDETEKHDLCVATADISTAFMHASIPEDEVIYIRAPPEMPGTGVTR